MRIAVGGIFHETNTFATQKTSARHFETHTLSEGAAIIDDFKGTTGSLGGIIDKAEELDVELVPLFYAETTPSGMVDQIVLDEYKEKIVRLIPPDIDGILLVLHGAMVSENDQDPEGTLIKEVREKAGHDVPVICTLDLHANVSPEMNAYADCMIGFDTYPHVDYYPRAVEAMDIMHRTVNGSIKPVSYLAKPDFMPVVQRMFTDAAPMKDLIELAWEIEEDPNVLNVSVTGGFPYADVKWAGFGFLVTTNGDEILAEKYAKHLNEALETRKEAFLFKSKDPEKGIIEAKALKERPIVLVDASDNIGGGSSADGTELLRLLLKHDMKSSLVFIKDEEAVKEAEKSGKGAVFSFEVGAKTDDKHGRPVLIEGRVKKLFHGEYRSERTNEIRTMGQTALVDTHGIQVILTTERTPGFDLQAPRELGVEPSQLDYIVVKGAVQWRSSYGKIAKNEIEVDCPGVTSANLDRFQYQNVRKGVYPIERRQNDAE